MYENRTMTGKEPLERKRRWYQFHLSTAVIASIAAAVVLWVNLSSFPPVLERRGWPVAGRFQRTRLLTMHDTVSGTDCYDRPYEFWDACLTWILPDVGTGLGCVFVAIVLSEYAIRRREDRKT